MALNVPLLRSSFELVVVYASAKGLFMQAAGAEA
jgi:hypothetical protein